MHFINELTSSSKLPSVTNVESLLLLALTDQAGKSKQQSMLFQYMVWMYQNDLAYTCPDRFQHACVFVKYALKCTAFRRMQHFKKAREDKKFVDAHFRDNDCAFQEIEFMKKLARRCYCYVKPEKIRWLNPGVLQVNTKGTTWITVQLVQIKNMISRQLDIVENIFAVLGIPVITSEEMQTVKDTDNIGIGHGVWTLNKHLRTKFVKVQDAQEFLMHDTKLGVALGFACSYSGGGAMRVPEVNEISFTRLTSGSVRSLRFSNGPLGGRCALAYDYTKMDNLVGAEASLSIQTTMKFTFERLSRLMLTHAIRFKPQAISVAMHEFGRRGAMCHGSMLAVEKGDRMSDDSLRYQFNAIIDEAVPGVSVASMRHVIEAVSLQAADGTQTKIQAREDMRQAMIALSAHSARTSDGRYAGDQYQLAGMPGFHVEKYHRAALAFNAHIGLELQVTQDMDDFMHAAWAWIKEFRPEVATASLHAVQGKGLETPAKTVPNFTGQDNASMFSQCDTQAWPSTVCKERGHDVDGKQGIAVYKAPSPKRLRMSDMPQDTTGLQLHIKRKCEEVHLESQQSDVRSAAEQVKLRQFPSTMPPGGCVTPSASTCSACEPTGSGQTQLRPVQAATLNHIAAIRKRIKGARVLIVQPCGTGKSVYFTTYAKTMNTIVILAQPYVSLKQQTNADAITGNIATSIQSGMSLKQMVQTEGLLIISSYEKLHSLVPSPPPIPLHAFLSVHSRRRFKHHL